MSHRHLQAAFAAVPQHAFKFEAGNAVNQQTTSPVVAVVDGDLIPFLPEHFSRSQPAGPAPITPIDSGRSIAGAAGLTQPFSKAVSVMCFSAAPMVTDSTLFQSHSFPHWRSCGQIRPHISGMLLVCEDRRSPSSIRPSAVSINQSGMLL